MDFSTDNMYCAVLVGCNKVKPKLMWVNKDLRELKDLIAAKLGCDVSQEFGNKDHVSNDDEDGSSSNPLCGYGNNWSFRIPQELKSKVLKEPVGFCDAQIYIFEQSKAMDPEQWKCIKDLLYEHVII